MRVFTADVEADDLLEDATKLWCASATELSAEDYTTEIKSFTLTDDKNIAKLFGDPEHILIMHNGISYDGPVVSKILGIDVKAEIVDTLYLSWYLYPKMLRHGLEKWGEELGHAKYAISDWENLSLDEYIRRCEDDVVIQTMLWQQIYQHLVLLYKDNKQIWHAIRHLNFKAKCAAMQEDAKWKLDVNAAVLASQDFTNKFDEAKLALEERMPKVPVYTKKTRPKKCYKANGEVSALGAKWGAVVEEHVNIENYMYGDPISYDHEVKYVSSYKEPNAGSSSQLKDWLYKLGWEPESFKHLRDKETNKVRKIPQIKNQDTEELCNSIEKLISKEPALAYLREMSVVKHRLGVVNGFLKNADVNDYVVAGVQGLTNTLRFKHRVCVNLPSVRKPYGKLIRSLLTSSSSNTELCGSDMSSLEDRTKQHYMWKHDPTYVKEMQVPGFDPHLDMAVAANLLTQADVKFYKSFDEDAPDNTEVMFAKHKKISLVRHAGKGTNYAATYGATGPTIARAAGVSEAVGDVLHKAYWERNWALTAIAEECVVKTSRGMKWLWNPIAKMWMFLKADKDKFSTLNQSTGTYAFDRWVYHILKRRPQLTAQFHDEVILELSKGHRDKMTKILKDAIKDVNEELKLNRNLDCDVDFGQTYAEIH